MKTIVQRSIYAGINLRGTRHQAKSASQLRRDDPALAAKWARFIARNKAQLVQEIARCVS